MTVLTLQAVRNNAATLLFDREDVREISPIYFLHDVDINSQIDAAKFYHDSGNGELPQINFFLCLVKSFVSLNEMRNFEQLLEIRINYFIGHTGGLEARGRAYNRACDTAALLSELIVTQLLPSWGGAIDFATPEAFQGPEEIKIDNRNVWRVALVFAGHKTFTF